MIPYLHLGSWEIFTFDALVYGGYSVAVLFLWRQFYEPHTKDLPRLLWLYIAVVALLGGSLGSRLWVLLPNVQLLFAEPTRFLNRDIFTVSAGSSWYGAFILTLVLMGILSKVLHLSLVRVLDITAPCIAVGQVLGRLGCFISGDGCYGRPTSLPWGIAFPDGLIPINTPVHPTPIYEALILFILFVVLWRLRLNGSPAGRSIGIYLIVSGSERFFVEFVRLHHKVFLGLTAYQIASLFLFLGGCFCFLYSMGTQKEGGSVV